MAKVPCSRCQELYDTRSLHICPECQRYVCDSCMEDGYCPDCAAKLSSED